MNQVQLTAINPEDSSVVPVACNNKGQVLLEDPLVVEGPPGKDGEDGKDGQDGKDGAPGKDGQDAASFVPSPNGVEEGYVLTADGFNGCRWDAPPAGAAYTKWSTLLRPRAKCTFVNNDVVNAFDGNTNTSVKVTGDSNNTTSFEWFNPVDLHIETCEFHFGTTEGSMTIFYQLGTEGVTVRSGQWTQCPRIANCVVSAASNWTFLFDSGNECSLAAVRINGTVLSDYLAFPQMQEFQLEASIKADPERYRRLLWSEKDKFPDTKPIQD